MAQVYLGKFNETLVAVKLLLDPSAAGEGDIQLAASMALSQDNPVLLNLKQEASTMAALRHPNILNFLGTCDTPPCLISEYCPRGSLYDTLQQARSTPAVAEQLGWSTRLRMVRTGLAQPAARYWVFVWSTCCFEGTQRPAALGVSYTAPPFFCLWLAGDGRSSGDAAPALLQAGLGPSRFEVPQPAHLRRLGGQGD